jgi:alanine-glyoxylate transaminase/serine-glyoxylate transaminase/serine-pyruvate transaminase
MPLRAGREFLAIPGPTTVPDEVLRAMHRPAMDIYSQEMVSLTESVLHDLSRLFVTEGRSYIYIANGHGAWEAALSNVLSRGDKVLVLESGRFAVGWGIAAAAMGLNVEVLEGSWQRAIRPHEVEARLRADSAGEIKAILCVQVDTASSAVNDIAAIGQAIRAAKHDALFMVDAVASLGCMLFDMDSWGIDVALSASQKGLMAPPGLAFVAASPRAREVHQRAGLRTPYWDWTEREGAEHYKKYSGTAPVHLLFAVRRALDMLFEEGFDAAHRRHHLLAQAVRRCVEAWSEAGAISFNIEREQDRADTVTTIVMRQPHDPLALQRYCREVCGVILGTGIGDLKGRAFRVAHMGHVNAPMVLGTLGAIEMGLIGLNVPIGGSGLAAAAHSLADAIGSKF